MCASKPLCWGGFLRLLFDLFVDLLPHRIVSTFKEEEEEDAEKVEIRADEEASQNKSLQMCG